MTKQIAVFFARSDFEDYPFDEEEYRQAYIELAQQITALGGVFWIVRGQETYEGGGRFRHGWRWDGQQFALVSQEVQIDVIYDKGSFRGGSALKVLNCPELSRLCTGKLATYEYFSELMPRTSLVKTQAELVKQLSAISNIRKVIKPPADQGGAGVVIGTTAEILAAPKSFPLLLQEFLDTSRGVPGILRGIHDFRMVIIDGEIVMAFIRTPPTGSLLANVARGGQTIEVSLEKIPTLARRLAKKIDQRLARYPHRVYSIDLGFVGANTPKLVELNSEPALFAAARGKAFLLFQKKLALALMAL